MSVLEYTHSDGVATITLNNPPQNRISKEMSLALAGALQEILGRADTRLLVLKAAGADFCNGGDITEWPGTTAEEFEETIAQAIQLTGLFQDLPMPTIVAVQGYCGGGGLEIALRGDLIIAADNAVFAHSEATLGAFTFLGGVQRVAERVGRTRAMQWAITAEHIDAKTAFDTGLINRVVPLEKLNSETESWIDELKHSATLSHVAHKKLLRAWSDGGISAADALMAKMAGEILHSQDAQNILPVAIEALRNGKSRPKFNFTGK